MAQRIKPRRGAWLIEALDKNRVPFQTPVYAKIVRLGGPIVLHAIKTTVDWAAAVQYRTEEDADEWVGTIRRHAPHVEWRVSERLYPVEYERITEDEVACK